MKSPKMVFTTTLTPALSSGRGRITRCALSSRKLCITRSVSSANYQPAATTSLIFNQSKSCDRCSLSPGERVRVRASVPLTFLFPHHTSPHVFRQRVRCACLKRIENHISNKLLLLPQLIIPEPNLLNAHRSQKFCSFGIVSLLLRKTVLPAVQFNGEAGLLTKEVEVVNPARMVAPKLVAAEASIAQPTPHQLFSPRLFLPQCAGAVSIGHGVILRRCGDFEKNGFTTALTPALSPRRGRIVRCLWLWRMVLDSSSAPARVLNLQTGGAT